MTGRDFNLSQLDFNLNSSFFFLYSGPKTLVFQTALTALLVSFLATAGSSFQRKDSDKPTACYLPGAKWQADKLGDWLVNVVKHLAAEDADISLRSWRTAQTELKGEGLGTHGSIARPENSFSVAPKLLDVFMVNFLCSLSCRPTVAVLQHHF